MNAACARVQLEQLSDRLGHRPMIAAPRQIAQHAQRVGERLELRATCVGHVEGTEAVAERVPGQHVFFGNGEERSAQRREHRQRIVGPLDRRERRAQRIDLLALVEGLAADEQVRHAARLERLHVGARHVGRVVDEAAEQQTHVAGRDRALAAAAVRHTPAAVGDEPAHELADRLGKRSRDGGLGDFHAAVGTRNRQGDDRRLSGRAAGGMASSGT